MLSKLLSVIGLVSIVFLVVMMNLTTPSEIGPIGVLVFFTLVYLVSFWVMSMMISVFFWIKSGMTNKKREGVGKRVYFYSSVIAFAPIMLVFMRSFGELNALEVILVGIFVIVACFFVSKKI